MTKAFYKLTQTMARQAARIDAGLPANDSATFPSLLALQANIHKEIAPTIEAMRTWDEFINSGRSLLDIVTEKRALPTLPAWARLTPSPLPVGLRMPANKCLAPAFMV